jgi:nucleotide-binding universal stress UspA family protein
VVEEDLAAGLTSERDDTAGADARPTGRRILLALDHRGLAEPAPPVVAALARRSLAEVVVLSVGDAGTGATPEAAVARLEAEGARARAEVVPAHDRPVAAAIVEAAQLLHADLVALGSHGRGDLVGLVLGSVGHRVAARLDCPILFVNGGGHEAPAQPIRRLLVAVDDSEAAMDAVATAAELAAEHEAAVLIVHSLDDEAPHALSHAVARDAALALLDQAARRVAAPGRTVTARLLTGPGSIAARVAAAAERWNADLIVIGSRRLTDLGGLFLGSVCHALIERTHRPVLVAARHRDAGPRRPGPSALGDRRSRP